MDSVLTHTSIATVSDALRFSPTPSKSRERNLAHWASTWPATHAGSSYGDEPPTHDRDFVSRPL